MDYLHIDNLFFKGKHGVSDHERKVEQEFLISVKCGVDIAAAAKSDQLYDTVDYQRVKDIVGEIITGSSCYLIEKLAEDIAAKILEDKRIQALELSIRKTAVWGNGVPGITIARP